MKDLQTEYFECQCHSTEHTLRFVFWVTGGDPEVYTEVFLLPGPWYKRIWKAVRYVFGYKCRYGHWDCTSMKPEDITRLRILCEEFERYVAANPPEK